MKYNSDKEGVKMKIRNRLIALFLVVVMISSVAPIANAYYFNDVTRDIGDPLFDAITIWQITGL